MTAWLWALGRMLGLGDMAGMRPSLTLAVIGIASKFDLGPGVSTPFFWMDHWFTILIFVVLAIFEASFDKVPKWDRLQGRLTMPEVSRQSPSVVDAVQIDEVALAWRGRPLIITVWTI